MGVCHPPHQEEHYKTRPCCVAEMRAPTPAGVDRPEKLLAYLEIPDLRGSLLLDSHRPQADSWRRDANGPGWREELRGAGVVKADRLGAGLNLEDVYEGLQAGAVSA